MTAPWKAVWLCVLELATVWYCAGNYVLLPCHYGEKGSFALKAPRVLDSDWYAPVGSCPKTVLVARQVVIFFRPPGFVNSPCGPQP
jgi:hypothetical protein